MITILILKNGAVDHCALQTRDREMAARELLDLRSNPDYMRVKPEQIHRQMHEIWGGDRVFTFIEL